MGTQTSLSFSHLRHLLSDLIKGWKDPRSGKNVQISLHDIVMSGFACMFYQDPSLLQFQQRFASKKHRSNLQTQFGVSRIPKDNQMKVILDKVPNECFEILFKQVFHRLQRAKYLDDFSSPLGGYLCALDGTQYYSSSKVQCQHCLKFNKKTGIMWAHRAVQAALVHPDQKTVIPFMPMDISNRYQKSHAAQDSERDRGLRLIKSLKRLHPRLSLTLLGDALYAEQPFIRATREKGYHFIFTVKSSRHRYLHNALENNLQKMVIIKKGEKHTYRWALDQPLTRGHSERVNYIGYTIDSPTGGGDYKRVYSGGWVTDHTPSSTQIDCLVRSARCRWRIENECFNKLKNQGYHLSHNDGHGEQFLGFNFFILTLLAFFMHQILRHKSVLFQKALSCAGSKRRLWEELRSIIRWIVFDTWEQLLTAFLDPDEVDIPIKGLPP